MTSNIYDQGQLYDAASTIMQQKLSQIQGVGQVFVGGSSLPAVRVEVNPTQLNAYGLSSRDVPQRFEPSKMPICPKGRSPTTLPPRTSPTNDQLLKADYYKPLIVGYHNGAAVELSDIADVHDSVEDIRAAGLMNGKPAILLIVFRQPGANIIDTVDRVRGASLHSRPRCPRGSTHHGRLDRTVTIRASVRKSRRTLLISIVLVILVVFVFLAEPARHAYPQRGRSRFLDRHLWRDVSVRLQHGQFSLMALTISTGFVVDDAIVVIENITRHLEQGMQPDAGGLARRAGNRLYRAVHQHFAGGRVHSHLADGRHCGPPVPGVCGHLSVAILVSLAVSLTTTPMMCARL